MKRYGKIITRLTPKQVIEGVKEISKILGNRRRFCEKFGFSEQVLSKYIKEVAPTKRMASIVDAYELGKETVEKKEGWKVIDPKNLPSGEVLVYEHALQGYDRFGISEINIEKNGGGFTAICSSGYPMSPTHYKEITAPNESVAVHKECTECDGFGVINLPLPDQEGLEEPELTDCPRCEGSGLVMHKDSVSNKQEEKDNEQGE